MEGFPVGFEPAEKAEARHRVLLLSSSVNSECYTPAVAARVTASGRITASELGSVMREHFFRQWRVAFVLLGLFAFSPLLSTAYHTIIEPEYLAGVSRVRWFLIWIPPILFGFLVVFLALFARVSARKQISTSPILSGKISFVFSDEEFNVETQFSSSRLKWGALHRAWESAQAFVLHPSIGSMMVIPKRMLDSPDDIDTLRTLIRANLGKNAALLTLRRPA